MRKILAVAALAAVSTVGLAGTANAATTKAATPAPVTAHDDFMGDATAVFNNYVESTGDYNQTVTTNPNFQFTTTTLKTTYTPYGGGWTTTFTFVQKHSLDGSKKDEATGTVTHTTPYGTTTKAFTAPAGSVAPFSLVGDNITVDPYSAAAETIRATQNAIVYVDGGQNAAYWFPTY
jgi:hypothetical protein